MVSNEKNSKIEVLNLGIHQLKSEFDAMLNSIDNLIGPNISTLLIGGIKGRNQYGVKLYTKNFLEIRICIFKFSLSNTVRI